MKRKNKLTASFALFFHCLNSAALPSGWAAPVLPAASEVELPGAAFQFTIAPELGTIQALESGPRGPSLIHIQTAHGNYEAQKKIQEILHDLKRRYGYTAIFVEGSPFPLKPELLRFFPENPDLTREVADGLARKAWLKGPELFLIENPEAEALGIEDLGAYRRNVAAFRSVIRRKDRAEKFLGAMEGDIRKLTAPLMNKALRHFQARLEAFEAGHMEFSDWLFFLKEHAAKRLEIHLDDPAVQIDWPMLFRMCALRKIEKNFDAAVFAREKKEFLKAAADFPGFEQIKELFHGGLSEHHLPDPETGILFEKLLAHAGPGFRLEKWPQTALFIGHLILQSELKAERLMEEADLLADRAALGLARSAQEKELVSLLKDYRLVQKLFALELTPKDYARTLERGNELDPSRILERFSALNREGRVRRTSFKGVRAIQRLHAAALRFYKGTQERDQAMLRRIEEAMPGAGGRAVVITGGFHGRPFHEHFRKLGWNYALITPKIRSIEGRESYLETMLGEAALESIMRALTHEEIKKASFDPMPFVAALVAETANLAPWKKLEELNALFGASPQIAQYGPSYGAMRLDWARSRWGQTGIRISFAARPEASIFLPGSEILETRRRLSFDGSGAVFASAAKTSAAAPAPAKVRSEVRASGLEISQGAPAKFFLEALGVDTQKALAQNLRDGYSFLTLPDSLALERLLGPWFDIRGIPKARRQIENAWVLLEASRPKSLLAILPGDQLAYLNIETYGVSDPSALGNLPSGGEFWKNFEPQTGYFLETVGQEGKYDLVNLARAGVSAGWDSFALSPKASLRLPVFADVFPPSNVYASEMFRRLRGRIRNGESILDLGTGSGNLAVAIAKTFKQVQVDAADSELWARKNAEASAAFHGLENRIRVFSSDGLRDLPASKRYSRIIFDAPVPVFQPGRLEFDIRTEDPQGRLLESVFMDLENHLAPGGVLDILMPQLPGKSGTLSMGGKHFFFQRIGKVFSGLGIYEVMPEATAKRSEVRMPEDRQAVSALEGEAEYTPIQEFLNVLELEKAELAETSPLSSEGFRVRAARIRPPAPGTARPEGPQILWSELGPAENFEFVYNAQNRLLGIFPALSPAIRDKSLRYFDLTHLHFEPPEIGGPLSAPLQAEIWELFAQEWRENQRILEAYRNQRGMTLDRESFMRNPAAYLVHSSETDGAPTHAFLQLNELTGTVAVVRFRPEELLIPGRSPVFERMFTREPGYRKIILPVFPTVFPPNYLMDFDYINSLQGFVRGLAFRPGENFLIGGVGSGIDTWLVLQTLSQAGLREMGVKVYGFDVNPFALAEIRSLLARTGFQMEALKIHDNILSEDGSLVFPGVNFRGGVWNLPRHVEGVRGAPLPGEFRRFAGYWDGVNVLHRFSKGLAQTLEPGGAFRVWNDPVDLRRREVKAIFDRDGLKTNFDPDVIAGGPYVFNIYKAPGGEATRSEVRTAGQSAGEFKALVRVIGGADDQGPGASSFLVSIGGKRILLDAGAESAPRLEGVPESEGPEIILLSHAHRDHSGDIPSAAAFFPLAALYGTLPTIQSASYIWKDGVSFVKGDKKEARENIKAARDRMIPIKPGVWYQAGEDLKMFLSPASHIWGANMIYLVTPRGNMLYTGDFSGDPIRGADLLEVLENIPIDYLWEESTYGERPREKNRGEREREFIAAIRKAFDQGGNVLIPSFALGRTADIALTIRSHQKTGEIPAGAKIFIDGLAAEILENYERFLADSADPKDRETYELLFGEGSDIQYVTPRLRQEIVEGKVKEPYVVLSGSGMLHGGRALYEYLPALAGDPRNAILMVGYQAVGSLGRAILDGKRSVYVDGEQIEIKSEVGYHDFGAHADQQNLVDLPVRVKARQVSLIHGSLKAKETLAELLRKQGFSVKIPKTGDELELEALPEEMLANRREFFDSLAAEPLPEVSLGQADAEKMPLGDKATWNFKSAKRILAGILLKKVGHRASDRNRQLIERFIDSVEAASDDVRLRLAEEAFSDDLRARLETLAEDPRREARAREELWNDLITKFGPDLFKEPPAPKPAKAKEPKKPPKTNEERFKENVDYFTAEILKAFGAETPAKGTLHARVLYYLPSVMGLMPEEALAREVIGKFLESVKQPDGSLRQGNIAMAISAYLREPAGSRGPENWRRAWFSLLRKFEPPGSSGAGRSEVRTQSQDWTPALQGVLMGEIMSRFKKLENLRGIELGPGERFGLLEELRSKGVDMEGVGKGLGKSASYLHEATSYGEYFKGQRAESVDFIVADASLYFMNSPYAEDIERALYGDPRVMAFSGVQKREERIRLRYEPILGVLKPGGILIITDRRGEEDNILSEAEAAKLGLRLEKRFSLTASLEKLYAGQGAVPIPEIVTVFKKMVSPAGPNAPEIRSEVRALSPSDTPGERRAKLVDRILAPLSEANEIKTGLENFKTIPEFKAFKAAIQEAPGMAYYFAPFHFDRLELNLDEGGRQASFDLSRGLKLTIVSLVREERGEHRTHIFKVRNAAGAEKIVGYMNYSLRAPEPGEPGPSANMGIDIFIPYRGGRNPEFPVDSREIFDASLRMIRHFHQEIIQFELLSGGQIKDIWAPASQMEGDTVQIGDMVQSAKFYLDAGFFPEGRRADADAALARRIKKEAVSDHELKRLARLSSFWVLPLGRSEVRSAGEYEYETSLKFGWRSGGVLELEIGGAVYELDGPRDILWQTPDGPPVTVEAAFLSYLQPLVSFLAYTGGVLDADEKDILLKAVYNDRRLEIRLGSPESARPHKSLEFILNFKTGQLVKVPEDFKNLNTEALAQALTALAYLPVLTDRNHPEDARRALMAYHQSTSAERIEFLRSRSWPDARSEVRMSPVPEDVGAILEKIGLPVPEKWTSVETSVLFKHLEVENLDPGVSRRLFSYFWEASPDIRALAPADLRDGLTEKIVQHRGPLGYAILSDLVLGDVRASTLLWLKKEIPEISPREEVFLWELMWHKNRAMTTRAGYLAEDTVVQGIIREKSNQGRAATVLDLGTGPEARALHKLKREYGQQVETFGVDLHFKIDIPEMLARGVHLVPADVRRGLPFADDSFDVVYASFLMEYMSRAEFEKIFPEIVRVLRPGGVFIFNDEPDFFKYTIGANLIRELAAPMNLRYDLFHESSAFRTELTVIEKKRSEVRAGIRRVLIADDDEAGREAHRAMIERWAESKGIEIEILEAADGRKALEIYTQSLASGENPVNFIWTDLEMPEMDGAGLARAAKALRPETPIVIWSGNSEKITEQVEKAGLLGAEVHSVLAKPASKSVIFYKLDQIHKIARSEVRTPDSAQVPAMVLSPAEKALFEGPRQKAVPLRLERIGFSALAGILSTLLGREIYSEKAGLLPPAASKVIEPRLGRGRLVQGPGFKAWLDALGASEGRLILGEEWMRRLAAKNPRALYLLLKALAALYQDKKLPEPLLAVSGSPDILKVMAQALQRSGNAIQGEEIAEVQRLIHKVGLEKLVRVFPREKAAEYVRAHDYGVAVLRDGEDSLDPGLVGAEFLLDPAVPLDDTDLAGVPFLMLALLKAAALVRSTPDPAKQREILSRQLERLIPGAKPSAAGFVIELAAYIEQEILEEKLLAVSA